MVAEKKIKQALAALPQGIEAVETLSTLPSDYRSQESNERNEYERER